MDTQTVRAVGFVVPPTKAHVVRVFALRVVAVLDNQATTAHTADSEAGDPEWPVSD
jgi:hypothetical protein